MASQSVLVTQGARTNGNAHYTVDRLVVRNDNVDFTDRICQDRRLVESWKRHDSLE